MQEITIVAVAFGASMLTFFSGFGLGTLLTPVFVLFFPPELAVAATAIVHFANNLFKLTLLGKHAVLRVVWRFGLPAIAGAYAGAYLLGFLSKSDQVIYLGSIETTALNMVLGSLIFAFALMELLPKLRNLEIGPRWLIPGGLLSGFFGGVSGHQGALRSAFLIKLNLSKEQFIATGVVIACMVDSARIATYATTFDFATLQPLIGLMAMATLAAFAGAFIGKHLLKKVTIHHLQIFVGILMVCIAILLFLNWI